MLFSLDYTKVAPTGYKDPATGKFVSVPEMIPELVVPDLSGFELKPYVSFRTDVEIEKRFFCCLKSMILKNRNEQM